MEYLISREKEIIENTAIIEEETNGTAADLTQSRLTTLSDSVRSRVQQLSVLEVIA